MVRGLVEKRVARAGRFKFVARLFSCASLLCAGFLCWGALAGTARGQSSPERSLDNELGVWGGYSFDSPHVFGVTSDRRLGLVAFRYARKWHTWQKVSLEYKVDIFPLALVDQPKIVTIPVPGPPPETIYFNSGREAVYGGGISPIGLKLNILPHRRFQPFVESSIGFVIAVRPIPFDVPGEDQFNFTFDFGAGFERFNSSRSRSWRLGYRYQHISNAYRSSINPGMDGNVIFFGYSFFK
jgi:hypothetical protein